MWSHFERPSLLYKNAGYCYHSVNVITFSLAQSEYYCILSVFLLILIFGFVHMNCVETRTEVELNCHKRTSQLRLVLSY